MTERVYFVYAFLEGGWKVKVGYTQNLANRIKELRRSYGTDVVLLTDVVGDTFDEAALHMILKNYLFRNEWFFPSKRVHALVAHIKQTEEIPESVRHLGRAIREERRAKRERVSIERVTNAYAASIIQKCDDWPYRNHEKIDHTSLDCIPLSRRNAT